MNYIHNTREDEKQCELKGRQADRKKKQKRGHSEKRSKERKIKSKIRE